MADGVGHDGEIARASAPIADRVVASHPDIFTPTEAVTYLKVQSARSLETLRAKGLLSGFRHGKGFLYHRHDLDVCAAKMFNRPIPNDPPTALEAYDHHFNRANRDNRTLNSRWRKS